MAGGVSAGCAPLHRPNTAACRVAAVIAPRRRQPRTGNGSTNVLARSKESLKGRIRPLTTIIGKHRQLESHSLIRDKVNASTSDLALGTASSLVASLVFTDWFQQLVAGSRFVIAALDEDLKRRLGAKQKAVLLSDETLAK